MSRLKRQLISRSARIQRRVGIGLGALLLMLWLPGATYSSWKMWRERERVDLPSVNVAQGADLVLDESSLGLRQAVWATFPPTDERIKVLVQRDESGRIRAVIASCKSCYAWRDEHQWSNGKLICGRCKQVMRLGDPGERVQGGRCVAESPRFNSQSGRMLIRAGDIARQVDLLRSAPTGPMEYPNTITR